jgi:hypothetical protein
MIDPARLEKHCGGDLVDGFNGDFFNHKSSLVKFLDMMIQLTVVYLFGVWTAFDAKILFSYVVWRTAV